MQTFLDGEENQNTKRETALVIAFLAAGNENRQLEDLPPADFGHVPEIFLLPPRTSLLAVKGYCVDMINKIVHSCL